MDAHHENYLPNHPRLYMWRLQDNINDFDKGGFVKFKLYRNSKSRPLPEEKLRSNVDGYVDYLLYCFSLTGSLANLTRFPYLAYSNNGCSFLVKFLILVVLIGIPWCFMEIAVGQYSGRGPTAIGDMVPIGKAPYSLDVYFTCIGHCRNPISYHGRSAFPPTTRCAYKTTGNWDAARLSASI
ncbi:sodium-dependent noradrenaline transporter-like [Myzus persicae]|uniref:sodium-dependent noradrenaline transporter-like n=1 Tax=Myzus persicae TaxID=13164 RepID=UPI000B936013|nr:sodium-dependent noradrenaline transporter-like [Myzus persicae]